MNKAICLKKQLKPCDKDADKEGAQIAAITHGHSLGYMPAAVVTHMINRCLMDGKNASLKEIVADARDTIAELFAGGKQLFKLTKIIDLAIELSENDNSDLENVHKLDQGWITKYMHMHSYTRQKM